MSLHGHYNHCHHTVQVAMHAHVHISKCIYVFIDGHPLPKQAQSDIASLDQQHSQLLQDMGGEGLRSTLKEASFIHLLDTGGQLSFQDSLPLLLGVPCTYIQVFNASRSLYERIPITYRPNDHTVVHLDDAENGRDMMLRSSSMQIMAQKYSNKLASFQQDSPTPQLHVLQVGSYKSELIEQGRLGEAIQEIHKAFLETGKPYYNSFLINARCTPKKFFRLQDLAAFFQKCGFVDGEIASSQFRALLQLLPLLCFYPLFNLEDVPDEDNFVCTDRGTFLKEVSTHLAMRLNVPTGAEMKTFKKTGILVFTHTCFKQLGVCQEILKALQHLGIVAQLPCKDGVESYFIPTALPQSSSNQNPTPSVAPLCLTYLIEKGASSFRCSYMPQGVFSCLGVEMIRQGCTIVAKENMRTQLLFCWRNLEIFIKKCSGYISIIPQVVKEISTLAELHTECAHLCRTISDFLSVATEAVLGSSFRSVAELAVAFECPCKEVGMPHLAVPSEMGKSLDCLETCRLQMYSIKQCIWFSPLDGVDGVEVSSGSS